VRNTVASTDLELPKTDELPPGFIDNFLSNVQAQEDLGKQPTPEEQLRLGITRLLGQLGSLTVQEDSLRFEGQAFILPKQYAGKVRGAIDFLENWLHQQEKPHQIIRSLPYRPLDGAHAFMQVMKTLTGTTGFGVTKMTMFGPKHPQYRTINIAHDKTAQVPWGDVKFPSFDAEFNIGATMDPERGIVFNLTCLAPKKWRQHIEAIFAMIEEYLKTNSIYRGKAINGAEEEPEFFDLSKVDPNSVFYSTDVLKQLRANIWVPIRHPDTLRARNMPIKRAVLLAGEYGTGKTLAGFLTALETDKHGYTFIQCRPGVDDPATVLRTAALYSPAVVFIEDIDTHTKGGSDMDISRMLEMLDGMGNKGSEIITIFTTNHLDRIQKGALRPGRIDAVVKIGDLDEAGFRNCVTYTVGADQLASDVDWHAVAAAFDGFRPAFVVEAARRATRYALGESETGEIDILTTEDLVLAADSLRPQLELMREAKEGANRTTFEDIIRGQVEGVVSRMVNDEVGRFRVEPATALNGASAS
jgi:transitional endoplasmic reticulum ATPase